MSGRETMPTVGPHLLQLSPQGVLEFLFLAAIVFAVWTGFQSGFVTQVASLLRLLVSFLAASRFFPQLSLIIQQIFTTSPIVSNILSFLAILLFVLLVMSWLYHLILYPLIGLLHITPGLGLLDRILGAVLAIIQELFWVAALLTIILLLPVHSVWQDAITRSSWGNTLVVSLSSVEQQLQQRLGSLQVPLIPSQGALDLPARDTERTITMHFPQGLHLQEDHKAERTMYVFVNQQRVARGLPPLALDPQLSALALAHSVDMFRHSYFGHVTPAGITPFQRMQEAGIRYTTAGENIAYAPTVYVADLGLMNSPPHRANILDPLYRRIGIGIVSGGIFGEMFTQDFTN